MEGRATKSLEFTDDNREMNVSTTIGHHQLPAAPDPSHVRLAADNGICRMTTDEDCQRVIKDIATEVFRLQRHTAVWHKNVCGVWAQRGLLYTCICSVYEHYIGTSMPAPIRVCSQPFSHSSEEVVPSVCQFRNQSVKLCELPKFGGTRVVSLGYFDRLYYITILTIQELHRELCLCLENGSITLGINLNHEEEHYPRTVGDILETLRDCWIGLTQKEIIATLDTAIRLRNLSHWAELISKDDQFPVEVKSSALSRAALLQSGREDLNEKFLSTSGLINVLEYDMSGAEICAFLKDLHLKTTSNKGAFFRAVNDKMNASLQADKSHLLVLSQAEALLNPAGAVLEEEDPSDPFTGDADQMDVMAGDDHEPRADGEEERELAALGSRRNHALVESVNTAVFGNPLGSRLRSQTGRSALRRDARRQVYPLDLYESGRYNTAAMLDGQTRRLWHTPTPAHASAPTTPSDLHYDFQPAAEHRSWQNQSSTGKASGEGSSFRAPGVPFTPLEHPPTEGTWSIQKSELYALLPQTPQYKTPGEASVSPGAGRRSRKASFNHLFGLVKGKGKRES